LLGNDNTGVANINGTVTVGLGTAAQGYIRLGLDDNAATTGTTAGTIDLLTKGMLITSRQIVVGANFDSGTGARQIGLLISGITNHPVENLTLENIQIELPGGGTAADAQIQLPEKEKAYPEYSMFGKVMPAYGIYARHVRDITFKNVQTTVKNPDARPAKIFIDVEGVTPADFAPAPTMTVK
jgi:hypothetical protein